MSRRLIAVAVVATSVVLGGCGEESTGGDTLTRALEAHAEGRTEEAEELYQDVLERDQSNKFAHYNLGLIAQNARRNDDAERAYRRALSVDENFVPAMFNLATLLTKAERDEAIALYRRIIKVDPNHASAHLNLGFLLKDTGKEAEGDAELKKAVDLDPDLKSRIPSSPTPQGPATP